MFSLKSGCSWASSSRANVTFFRAVYWGEQVEGLEYQPEVEPLFPHLALPLGGGIGGVEDQIAGHGDGALVRFLQKIQAPQQRGLAGAGGADDGQGLALLQIKADILQHPGGAEVLFDVMYFQNCHTAFPSLLKEVQLLFQLAQQHRDDAAEDQIVDGSEEQRPGEAAMPELPFMKDSPIQMTSCRAMTRAREVSFTR